MPCLIIAGHPSAGKTTLATLLKERALLHDTIDEVVILNEESECGCVQNKNDASKNQVGETSSTEKVATTKQELYQTSTAEKQTRGALKAAFDRAVTKSGGASRRLVILDSMNYIKGFRYELHCISKASGEKHGILWVLNRLSVVQQWNKSYSSELLNELMSRFEPPDDRNRWDKPLFTVDVAMAEAAANPTSSSSLTQEKEAPMGKLSSKNEVLENSVYNMHSLGEAFGTTELADATAAPSSQRPNKSAFVPVSKAPKKSAFQRRKKVSKDKSKIASGSTNQENKIIFDTSILTSPQSQKGTDISERVPRGENSEASPSLSPPPASSQPEETVNTKSLEEQLDDILHTFLLQTKNLKEGMSTRQYD